MINITLKEYIMSFTVLILFTIWVSRKMKNKLFLIVGILTTQLGLFTAVFLDSLKYKWFISNFNIIIAIFALYLMLERYKEFTEPSVLDNKDLIKKWLLWCFATGFSIRFLIRLIIALLLLLSFSFT